MREQQGLVCLDRIGHPDPKCNLKLSEVSTNTIQTCLTSHYCRLFPHYELNKIHQPKVDSSWCPFPLQLETVQQMWTYFRWDNWITPIVQRMSFKKSATGRRRDMHNMDRIFFLLRRIASVLYTVQQFRNKVRLFSSKGTLRVYAKCSIIWTNSVSSESLSSKVQTSAFGLIRETVGTTNVDIYLLFLCLFMCAISDTCWKNILPVFQKASSCWERFSNRVRTFCLALLWHCFRAVWTLPCNNGFLHFCVVHSQGAPLLV